MRSTTLFVEVERFGPRTTAASLAARPLPHEREAETVRALVGPVARAVDGAGPVLVRAEGEIYPAYSDGLAAELLARGIEVWWPEPRRWRVGNGEGDGLARVLRAWR